MCGKVYIAKVDLIKPDQCSIILDGLYCHYKISALHFDCGLHCHFII